MTAHKPVSSASLISVYGGRECVGFVLSRGPKGFEAVAGPSGERSLGLFKSQDEAAAAIMQNRS